MWFYRNAELAFEGTTGPNDRAGAVREVEQYLSERPGKGLFDTRGRMLSGPVFLLRARVEHARRD